MFPGFNRQRGHFAFVTYQQQQAVFENGYPSLRLAVFYPVAGNADSS